MVDELTYTATKGRTHDAIVDAWSRLHAILELAETVMHSMRFIDQNLARGRYAKGIAVSHTKAMNALEKASEAIWKVEEWLTRSQIASAKGRRGQLSIELNRRCFANWHTAHWVEIFDWFQEVGISCDPSEERKLGDKAPPLKPEQVINGIRALRENTKDLAVDDISRMQTNLEIEAYLALSI